MENAALPPESGTPGSRGDEWGQVRAAAKKLGPLAPLAVLASTLPLIGLAALIYFRQDMANALRAMGPAAIPTYVAVFALTSGLAIFPTHIQAVIGGWLFGFRTGGAMAVLGATLGALIGYLIARAAGRDRALGLIAEWPQSRAVYSALLEHGIARRMGLVSLLRLSPSSPFALTNLVLAATRVPIVQYLLCTAIGMAPRTVAAAWVGQGLSDLSGATSNQRWVTILGIIATVIAVVVIGAIANAAVKRATAKRPSGQ